MSEACLMPLVVLYDMQRGRYVISAAEDGYLLLDKSATDRLVQEGVLEQVGVEDDVVIYAVSPTMTSIDLQIMLTADVVARVLSKWTLQNVQFEVADYGQLAASAQPADLPLTVTVQWSLLDYRLYSMRFPEQKDL
jgi:hypothetical protein